MMHGQKNITLIFVCPCIISIDGKE